MRVRVAGTDDATSVAELCRALDYPTTPDQARARLTRLGEDPDHEVLVAESESGDILGWIHVGGVDRIESDRFAEIGGLVVASSARRKGVGRRLVDAARDWASTNDFQKLRVRSNANRPEAHAFYSRLGFDDVKTQVVYELR